MDVYELTCIMYVSVTSHTQRNLMMTYTRGLYQLPDSKRSRMRFMCWIRWIYIMNVRPKGTFRVKKLLLRMHCET